MIDPAGVSRISSTQIRKDLSSLGRLGRRGQGYAINPLVEQLAWVLGLEHDWRIAIAGFGYLGHALATFITSRESRFCIAARGITVADIASMEHDIQRADCNIGVIAVPAPAAQAIAHRMAAAGFAPLTREAGH
jgi:redox-sensing transcriptional repressor